jgi:hypothetical protein
LLLPTCPRGHAVTLGFMDWGVHGLVFHQSGLYALRAHERGLSSPLNYELIEILMACNIMPMVLAAYSRSSPHVS